MTATLSNTYFIGTAPPPPGEMAANPSIEQTPDGLWFAVINQRTGDFRYVDSYSRASEIVGQLNG